MNTTQKYFDAWNNDDNARVEFLDDNACREAIIRAEPNLLVHFNNETKGAYKADICRAAALYNTGGYYFDVDIKVVSAVRLDPDISFSSVREEIKKNKQNFNFFQAFLASAPKHSVMRETLRYMLAYYEGKHKLHGERCVNVFSYSMLPLNNTLYFLSHVLPLCCHIICTLLPTFLYT